jgi:hypothetical protein
MSGGNSVVGLWRDREPAQQQAVGLGDALIVDTPIESDVIDNEDIADDESWPESRRWQRRVATVGASLLAISWVGALAYERITSLGGRPIALSDALGYISTASAPLAFIGVGWMLLTRSSKSEQRRFQRTSEALHSEGQRLETLLTFISTRIEQSRSSLADQGDKLMSLGDDAATRLNAITRAMGNEIETVSRHAQGLTSSAAAARGDLAVLLASMPKANVQTRQMITSLQETGLVAHEKAAELTAQLSLLQTRGREADEIAGNAAAKLAAHLTRMEGVSEVAGARLEQAAGQMTGAVDEALERAGLALESARQGMEAQGAAMMAMIEQNQAKLAQTGAESAEVLSKRIEEISGQIDHVAQVFAGQGDVSQTLIARLNGDIEQIEGRFADFDKQGTERTERLSMAVVALRNHADELKTSLANGGDTANTLVGRVESLMTALDAAAREMDETIPAAFGRLESKAKESMDTINAATPIITLLSETATEALTKLAEADESLLRQRSALEAMAGMSGTQITEIKATADALAQTIATTTANAHALTHTAGPNLVESLVRVRDTAQQATEHVRTAFAEIIPQQAQALGDQSKAALQEALTAQVEVQMNAIADTTADAVAAAQKATDRLMRQMLTISETSAALEARIADAKADVEHSDQANFARRVALLIESLNSTAIDVTKIFSNDVTDTAWASYLRGDRGIFTRRAVKLLDATEVKEIARNYEGDTEFREQVNRYIHDFESMLRNVLASRDGSPLGVTLLSSDNGKLYVALAQAIERLRS